MEPMIFGDEKRKKRLIWNLTANVGIGQPNQREDVQLVQFGYFAMANNTKNPPKPDLKAIYAAVRPGSEFTGREEDPLMRAIRAHQRSRGGAQDGRVSVMRGLSYQGADGPHSFIVLVMNNNFADLMPDDFPRLDKHLGCPQSVREAVRRHCLP